MSDQTPPPAQPPVEPPAGGAPPPAPAVPPAAPAAPPAAPAVPPAAPAAPPVATPPAAPPPIPPAPAAPVATPGGNFNSTKNKTIIMIAGGVVGVGLLGGLAALVLGGGGDTGEKTTAGNHSGVLNPTPVSNNNPPPPQPSTPTTPPETTAPAPTTPPEQPAPAPAAGGSVTTIGSGVQIPVPDGWSVEGSDGSSVTMGNGQSSFIYALTGTADASSSALSILQGNLDSVLNPNNYSNLQFGQPADMQPVGSATSASQVEYDATWVDSQGSFPLHGIAVCVVRSDGTALIMTGEHAPPKEFSDAFPDLAAVINGALNAFSGT